MTTLLALAMCTRFGNSCNPACWRWLFLVRGQWQMPFACFDRRVTTPPLKHVSTTAAASTCFIFYSNLLLLKCPETLSDLFLGTKDGELGLNFLSTTSEPHFSKTTAQDCLDTLPDTEYKTPQSLLHHSKNSVIKRYYTVNSLILQTQHVDRFGWKQYEMYPYWPWSYLHN